MCRFLPKPKPVGEWWCVRDPKSILIFEKASRRARSQLEEHEEVVEDHSDEAHQEEAALVEVLLEVDQEVALLDGEHPEVAALGEAHLEEEEAASVVVAEVAASRMYHTVDEAWSCIHAAFRFGFMEYPAAPGKVRRHTHLGNTIQMTGDLEAENTIAFCHHTTFTIEVTIWPHLGRTADESSSMQVIRGFCLCRLATTEGTHLFEEYAICLD